jgi:hypothetical protein
MVDTAPAGGANSLHCLLDGKPEVGNDQEEGVKMINIKRRWLLSAASGLAFFAAAKQLRAASAIIPGDAVTDHKQLLSEAVYLAQENRKQGGRPFGAVLTVAGKVVATGVNNSMQMHDVSAHAEMAGRTLAGARDGRI